MTTTIEDSRYLDYLDWTLTSGLWDGKPISWKQGADAIQELYAKALLNILSQDPREELATQLAYIGSPPQTKPLIAKEIQALQFSDGEVMPIGLGKSLSKFWKKHKTEILIGLAIAVVVTVVVVVAVTTGGTAVPAIAGAGAGFEVLDELTKADPLPKSVAAKIPPKPMPQFDHRGITLNDEHVPFNEILNTFPQLTPHPANFLNPPNLPSLFDPLYPIPDFPPPQQGEIPLYTNPEFIPVAGRPRPAQKLWISDFVSVIGKEMQDPELFDPNITIERERTPNSSKFSTPGQTLPHLRIYGINGMNTDLAQAQSHANYVAQFARGISIDWIHNATHGPLIDILEIFTCNYHGHSPNTAKLLQENWINFHETHKDNPYLKLLQFCHSQGAIHVRNALENLPEEIRKRVIVIAIAPAAIIPKESCYDSFMYACKGDLVPMGEMFALSLQRDPDTFKAPPEFIENFIAYRDQIIWVDPDPDTTNAHDFQNPAFIKRIKEHIEDHVKREGMYP